jgi:hypothetical protein
MEIECKEEQLEKNDEKEQDTNIVSDSDELSLV